MNKYRTHNCSELRISDTDKEVKISGWVHRTRDHGNLIFIDLRDNYGITQCVVDSKNKNFNKVSSLSNECVLKITGIVIKRSSETVNRNLKTGEIEINVTFCELLSKSDVLPLPVNSDIDYGEEIGVIDLKPPWKRLDLQQAIKDFSGIEGSHLCS